jgi:hypothetical protein
MSSNEGSIFPTLILYAVIGLLAVFVLLGLGGFFDSGNVPGKECYNYETASGDIANTCDQ